MKTKFAWSIIVLLALTAASLAQTTAPSGAPPQERLEVDHPTKAQQELIDLSSQKWIWMADRNTDALNKLFDDQAFFTHMGGTWNKSREIEIIKSGSIWYKHASVEDVSVRVFGTTAIVLTKMHLVAVVGGNEVTNPFMVTEVYLKEDGQWKLGQLTFSHLIGR